MSKNFELHTNKQSPGTFTDTHLDSSEVSVTRRAMLDKKHTSSEFLPDRNYDYTSLEKYIFCDVCGLTSPSFESSSVL